MLWLGKNLLDLDPEAMRRKRRDLQIIFQDPQASLNPRMTVGEIISDPLKTFKTGQAMLSAGYTDAQVDGVLWDNPVAYYGQSGRLVLDPVPGFSVAESGTFEGNLADDPQVRFTPSGKQITEITVLVNQRRQNSDGEWVDAEPTRHVVRAFKALAVNVAESVAKGDRVFVHGTWDDRGVDRPADR